MSLIQSNNMTAIVDSYFTKTIENLLMKTFYLASNFLIADTILRSLQYINEYRKYKKHYDNTKDRIQDRVFSYNKQTKFLFSLFAILTAVIFIKDNFFWEKLLENITSIIIIYTIFKYIGADYSQLDIAKWIRSKSGCDYASGMASNYFHGYINISIPGKSGIRERIKYYEDKEKVEFAIKRLFVTIPNSFHSKPVFRSKILEKANAKLEVVVKDRAGVERPYKNDVYRFTEKINNKNYYIAVEGATPLLSFHEALQSSITNTPDMIALKREILLQFYKSIKKYCMENKETNKEIEFVYYDDYINEVEVDVGRVLKQRIEKMLLENQD